MAGTPADEWRDAAALHRGKVEEFMKTYQIFEHTRGDFFCMLKAEYMPICEEKRNCKHAEKCHKFLLFSRIMTLTRWVQEDAKTITSQKRDLNYLLTERERKRYEHRKEGNGWSAACKDMQQQRTRAEMQVEEKKKEIIELQKKLDEERAKNTRLEYQNEKIEDRIASLQQQIQEQKTATKATKQREKPDTAKVSTSIEQKIINYLKSCGREPQVVSEIVAALGLVPETVYDALESLEKQGLIEAQEGEDGIREYSLP